MSGRVSVSPDATTGRAGAARWAPRIAAVVVGWIAFAYRFQDPFFHNDHFEHLSMARQMLFGEWPGRDMFDPGRPLTYALSAAAQLVFGPTLFSEALLTVTALAVGAALTYTVAARASRSPWIAAVAAVLVIVIGPRLYAYPKILVLATALAVIWAYVDAPSRWRTASLALMTVCAFLMRHDFVVYVGAAVLVAIVAREWGRGVWRPLLLYAGVAAVLVSPYLAWLGINGRLLNDSAGGASAMVSATQVTLRPLHVNWKDGVIRLLPRTPDVTVHWRDGLGAVDRRELETRYHLAVREEDGQTVRYVVEDARPQNILALIGDPHVLDTNGIDRHTATLTRGRLTRALDRAGITRWTWAPLFDRDNAEVWLYDLFFLLTLAALIGAIAGRGETVTMRIQVGSTAVMALLALLYLIRGSLDSRLPDVVVPVAVAAAWCLGRVRERMRRVARGPALAITAAVLTVIVLTWVSLTVYEPGTSVSRVTAAWDPARLAAVGRSLRRPPMEAAQPGSDPVQALTRYVHECTTADERVLLVAYEPQVFYYAQRLFAGGMPYVHQRRFSSPRDQEKIVATLRAQRVPLVIVEEDHARMLEEDYPAVHQYVVSRFTYAGSSTFDTPLRFRIYATPSQLRGERNGLPCGSR